MLVTRSDLLPDGNGPCCREGAVIHARAGDQVRHQADIGGCEALSLQRVQKQHQGLTEPRVATRYSARWLTRSSAKPTLLRQFRHARICAALASPGACPWAFKLTVTEA